MKTFFAVLELLCKYGLIGVSFLGLLKMISFSDKNDPILWAVLTLFPLLFILAASAGSK